MVKISLRRGIGLSRELGMYRAGLERSVPCYTQSRKRAPDAAVAGEDCFLGDQEMPNSQSSEWKDKKEAD